ncbi:MAG TPA: TolC family protein [Oculatellaceae cyanobacterium]
MANIQSARWQARQSLLKANKEVVTVLKQVHTSLLQSLDTERTIQETSDEVASATEELRLARLRFKSGLGTNLDVITAQRDYTTSLIDKAQAIINFNIAQAQLVHDVGMISVDALTSGRLLTKTIGGTAQ